MPFGSKQIRVGQKSRAHIRWRSALAPPGEYAEMICAMRAVAAITVATCYKLQQLYVFFNFYAREACWRGIAITRRLSVCLYATGERL